jgi:hypothetical protein
MWLFAALVMKEAALIRKRSMARASTHWSYPHPDAQARTNETALNDCWHVYHKQNWRQWPTQSTSMEAMAA